jgi:glutathione S-transferase
MSSLTLIVGNRNYSSWSLRPHLALAHAGASFEEVMIPLDRPDTRENILRHSPTGRVPVLVHDGVSIWDSLAILEYVAELFPAAKLWPEERAARAWARSTSAEMHSGFASLRQELPMDLRNRVSKSWSGAVDADIARILASWEACRAAHGASGPFLFGTFSNADCMYAPVVGRFFTYGVPVSGAARAYMDAVWALPSMQAWLEAARNEPYTIPH